MHRALALLVVIAGCGSSEYYPPLPTYDPDAAVSCGKVTCASVGATCGPIGDGCGDVQTDCGTCPAGQVCGGGSGTPFQCGERPCTPRTCADVGATCGLVSDGCGALIRCGTCVGAEVCGGAGVPNQCAVPPCTGLCQQRDACPAQPKTRITGIVTAPGHASGSPFGPPDPIFGALVYIPNGAVGPPTYGVKPFTPGVACDSCSSLVSEPPLASVTTTVDGGFAIDDAPCGTNIPLVIQLGRWRRQITIPSVACCATTTLTNAQTHLPRTRTGEPGDVRSDIPLMAVSTGSVDPMHCVLRKMGIDDREFTNPTGPGRVHLYQDNGARIDATTPDATALYGAGGALSRYDMSLFECVGARAPKADPDQSRVIAYANAGGRVFSTHFSYVWLTDSTGTAASNTGPLPFSLTANWLVDQAQADTATAVVDQSLQGDPETQARRIAFAQWLSLVGASTTPGQIPLQTVRNDFTSVNPASATAAGTPAQRWLSTIAPFSAPVQYTFDTPVSYTAASPPAQRCGRVLFSDFHVTDSLANNTTFPAECQDAPMTPQEKTLEFLLFDLATCIGPPPRACRPRTCAEQGVYCGLAGDGCDDGVILACGACTNGRTCGGGGPGICGTGACQPRACGVNECGVIGDGCGGTADCGLCSSGESCGGGDVPNTCVLILQ